MPRPPDAGFFGRDETLLALDRAFDTQPVVLVHAFAGAGKTSTAAEFARWYAATGGLHHLQLGAGPVLWSSFGHHLPLDRLLDAAGDAFADLLEANGIHWQALTDPDVRRDLVLQLLAQVPVLWVWDNTCRVSSVMVRAGVFGRVKIHHAPICSEISPISDTTRFQVRVVSGHADRT